MKYIKNKKFMISAIMSVALLAISGVVNFYAGVYATENASNSVTDIVLSNIRVYDVDGIFVYGTIVFWIFILFLCLTKPQRIPFILKSAALFFLIRSVFITLTHIGPYPTHLVFDSNILKRFVFAGDLFFSGHTGLPFLMSLIFWNNIYLRVLFIVAAFTGGVIVLMAHLHYSIDVLSAFFITYSIYRIAEIFFKKDKEVFANGLT